MTSTSTPMDHGSPAPTPISDASGLERLFRESVAQGRALVAEAIADGGLGGPAHISDDEGNHANVRRLVLDMVEEYGRHVGHADLIRESVDGLVGEDPE